MRAKATVIRGSVRAMAWTSDMTVATACGMPAGIMPSARTTEESGTRHFLYVTPSEPQQLVWLVPQVGVDYTVTTSSHLDWEIK